jgi:signal transduction histidine kinase
MSGGITWWLVSGLVTENNQQSLAASVVTYRGIVTLTTCPLRRANKCVGQPQSADEFAGLLDSYLAQRGSLQTGDRLLVLDSGAPSSVVYDSEGRIAGSSLRIPLNHVVTIGNQKVFEGRTQVGGLSYLYAAATVGANPYARWVVLARPQEAVAAQTDDRLFPALLGASGAALLLAVLVSTFLARALTRPLQELRKAAEDIAAGSYGRRVVEVGPGEVGVVARAFNRMAEAVERARRQQREFLADVSHELKTPLTSLIGFSEAMVDGSLRTGEERDRAAGIVNEEANRVLRMAQELLDLARVEAGSVTYHLEPVDLAGPLDHEAGVVRPRAERRRLRLQVDAAADLPPVHADPERLHQILGNLVDNAIKYAPEDSEVRITAESHPHWVVTEVRNVVGAHPPDTDRMFDRFYRADPARSSSVSGVGLGLAISSELAIAQGGRLTAYLRGEWLHVRLAMPAASGGARNGGRAAGPVPRATSTDGVDPQRRP